MLTSPNDDFSKTTLAAVPGLLGKLQYVVGLRQGNGEYYHWGMARSHGEASANLAIADAHSNLFILLLRTPIRVLWVEASGLAAELSISVREYVGRLQAQPERFIPPQLRGGSGRHFNSVLLALCSLAAVSEPKADRAA